MASTVPRPSKTAEQSFACAFCSKLLQEPKLLPNCLHRFCKKCLDGLIRASPTSTFLCLKCRTEYAIPAEGADGFKTDSLIAEIIASLQEVEPVHQSTQMRPTEEPEVIPNGSANHGRRQRTHSDDTVQYDHWENPERMSNGTIAELHEESRVTIDTIKANKWDVYGIASNNYGTMVLTGQTQSNRSFIVAVDSQGSLLYSRELEGERRTVFPNLLYCDCLSPSRIVTACMSGQIGMFNLHDRSYNSRRMKAIFGTWPSDRYLSSIAVDRARGMILVGAKFRHGSGLELLVFDDHLTYLNTLMLPGVIQYTGDVVVYNDDLLVCDRKMHRAFICTMDPERRNIRSSKELIKPDWAGTSQLSIGGSCFAGGTPYVLWVCKSGDHERRQVVRYTPDGSRILAKQDVDKGAFQMCSSTMDGLEKIHIATLTSGMVYTYAVP